MNIYLAFYYILYINIIKCYTVYTCSSYYIYHHKCLLQRHYVVFESEGV